MVSFSSAQYKSYSQAPYWGRSRLNKLMFSKWVKANRQHADTKMLLTASVCPFVPRHERARGGRERDGRGEVEETNVKTVKFRKKDQREEKTEPIKTRRKNSSHAAVLPPFSVDHNRSDPVGQSVPFPSHPFLFPFLRLDRWDCSSFTVLT